MEENFKNKLGFTIFILIVLTLAIGGYIFMNYTLNDNNKNENNTKKEDYRIDKSKDYIYFINDSIISESAEIYYQDVVINLDTQTVLTESLEKENKIYKNSIKYISDNEVISEIINYNNDDIYSVTFREYEDYEYDNYVSLLIKDYNYSCFDNITFYKTKSYIFDKSTGKLLTEEDILKIYNTNLDKIKNDMRTYLKSKQATNDGVDVIKIDETIDNLDNYALYINDYGRLFITYLVKTTQVDYNEVMEVS